MSRIVLRATSRFIRVSMARYTTPIPPLPRTSRNSYRSLRLVRFDAMTRLGRAFPPEDCTVSGGCTPVHVTDEVIGPSGWNDFAGSWQAYDSRLNSPSGALRRV